METLRQEPHICQIFDYGISQGQYFIATAWYRMSLKSWRSKQPKGSLANSVPLYLSIATKLIHAVSRLDEYHVVHYDLKVRETSLYSFIDNQNKVFFQ